MKTDINRIFGIFVCCGLGILLCGNAALYAGPEPSIDSPLEQNIDAFLKQLRSKKELTYSDQTSFVVYDLSRQKKLVSINEDRQTMAATLVSNFVMLVYFHEVKHGRLQHNNKNRYHLKQMIQANSNTSTNYFIRLIGGPYTVNRKLKANYPYFKQTKIIEYIPTNGRTYRNTTSAHDLNRFFVHMKTFPTPKK